MAWDPHATRNPAPASKVGPPQNPTCGVLHSTESRLGFRPGSSYFGHDGWPHATVTRSGGKATTFQHVPADRCSRALRNLAGGVETNNAGCYQIEIDWNAADMPNLPADVLAELRRHMRWVESVTRIPRLSSVEFHPYPPPERLGRESWRLTFTAWLGYRGWLGHQHVPENDHGDPGLINIAFLLDAAPAPAPPEDDIVATLKELSDMLDAKLDDRLAPNGNNPTIRGLVEAIYNVTVLDGGASGDPAKIAEAVLAGLPSDLAAEVVAEMGKALAS